MRNLVGSFWSNDQSLSILLWLLGATIFVIVPSMALVDARGWERLAFAGFFLGLIATGVSSAWRDRERRNLLVLVGALPIAVMAIELVSHPPVITFLAAGARVGVVGLFIVIIFSRVVAPGPVTRARIKGAIAVYLLAGVIFEELYRVIVIASPGSLTIHATNPLSPHFTAELMYFSFSTLTTAGYGDIVPVHAYARATANFEAVFGQLYLVLLIGRLLTLSMLDQSSGSKG
jgi:hypothetical protein